jgi:hypothetical protein
VKNDFKSYSQGIVMTGKQVDEFQKKANMEFRREVSRQTKRLSAPEYNVEKILNEIETLNDECVFATDIESKIKRKIGVRSYGTRKKISMGV